MSRKRTNRNRKEKKRSASRPRFRVGARVVVPGVTPDQNLPGLTLEGWSGTVRSVKREGEEIWYLVAWDQATLQKIPPEYEAFCEQHDLLTDTFPPTPAGSSGR